MADLHSTLTDGFVERFTSNVARIRELAAPLTDAQFWRKPFSFGNSFGHLVLHLTGNLNYYIGAQIANTGYVRDRPREFTDTKPPSKEKTLQCLDEAIAIVLRTVRAQSTDDWARDYSAAGTKSPNRLAMVLQCDSHMQLHIGQMIYLCYELRRQTRTQ